MKQRDSVSKLFKVIHGETSTSLLYVLKLRLAALCSLILVFLLLLPSCAVSQTATYPSVSFSDSEEETESSLDTEPSATTALSDNTEVIRVAAPISSETAKYLSLLYSAKKQGLFPKGETGSTITTDFLLAIEPEFLVDVIQTPSTGATFSMVETWRNDNIFTDILYVNSLSPFFEKDRIIPIDKHLASVTTITPEKIYPDMISTCYIGSSLYGIPYAASAKLMFWNQEVTKASGKEFLPFSLTIPTLELISADVATMNAGTEDQVDQKPFYALYDPSSLLPVLPNAYDVNAKWFVYDDHVFHFRSEAFQKTASFFQIYSGQKYFSVEALLPDEQAKEFGNVDPRISGRVAAWVGSSFDIPYWSTALPDVTITKIPSETDGSVSPLALTVYPLCVSADAKNPELASEFAAFLASDEDAVLLTDRLENRAGFLPVLTSDAVWRLILENQTYGDRLIEWKKDMGTAIYNPHTNEEDTTQFIEKLLEKYVPKMMLPDADIEQLLTDMSTESKQSI